MSDHNKHLMREVEQWSAQADEAKSPSDLYAITDSMKQFGGPIKFRLGKLYAVAAIVAALAVGLAYTFISSRYYPSWLYSVANELGWGASTTGFWIIAVLVIIALVTFGVARSKNGKITGLCNTLMHKASLLQYGLRPIGDSLVARELPTFGELNRGNYSRAIQNSYQGYHQGTEHSFDYQAYRLHYVDKEETSSYNSDTKEWETEVKYEHYDRSGIVVDFPYAKGIHISKGYETTLYGAPYKPASLEFDKVFHCRGRDEMTLARFLKPATVQHLIQAASTIPGLTIEVNKNGRLCLGCNHDHVVQTIQKLTDETNPRVSPEGFDAFIRASVSMPRLDNLTELAHTLMRYNDSNFS